MNTEIIKHLFNKYRITGELLSEFLEVSLSTGVRWKKSPETISLDKITKICQLLDIQISDILVVEKSLKFKKPKK